MKCPRDETELRSRKYEADIDVDACPSCGGIWLDKDELEVIQESKEHDYTAELGRMPELGIQAYALARQKLQQTISCPNCAAEMEGCEYARCSQVMIDVCPKCHGIWLDKGELEALEVFFERSRLEARELRRGFFADFRTLHLK